ncbi:MAG: Gfo/Idh/MocA family oxidoreductase [Gammaproteobacteria bacterium]|nr:Gfo/Idh/MocA family oxidoreductase [Gammaproteobacteria bacterium]
MRSILLVGAGGMARAYFDVIQKLDIDFEIVCRSASSAAKFEKEKGHRPIHGGLEEYLKCSNTPSHAIVAVGVEHLRETTERLLNFGVKNILVEKPVGLYIEDIDSLNAAAYQINANVYVAYNRRFYASVSRLLELSDGDGGIRSISFDFSEWSDRIAPLIKGAGVKERWVLSNSTHVIDLAFFLAGRPAELSSYVSGQLDWHPNGSCFSGSGITEQGVLFNYRADWNAPGRWAVVAYTANFKLELAPLEGLVVTKRNSVIAERIDLDCDLETKYKPGLFKQVQAFIGEDKSKLCSIAEQAKNYPFYTRIAGYK